MKAILDSGNSIGRVVLPGDRLIKSSETKGGSYKITTRNGGKVKNKKGWLQWIRLDSEKRNMNPCRKYWGKRKDRKKIKKGLMRENEHFIYYR